MTPNEYQKKAHETASYPENIVYNTEDDLIAEMKWIYPALGLAEEAGEVSGKFAKMVRDNECLMSEAKRIEIIKELGDVCWFVAELSTVLGVDLEEVMQRNLDKLASRKERGVIHGSGDNR